MEAPSALNQVFARRWAVPILAQLAGEGGCKFVSLASNLEGSRASLKASLGLLDTLGLVIPNSGTGHPMRPEYVLTERGKMICEPAAALVRALDRAGELESGLKKWSMPTVHVVHGGADRFGDIVRALSSATDRAVSLALSDMQGSMYIDRNLVDGRPPFNVYRLSRKAKRFASILEAIDSVLCGDG